MTEEQRRFETLLRLLDARLLALLAPVARRLNLALQRAADRQGVVPPRKLPYIRSLVDSAVAGVFGASPGAQFGDDGKPRTPIAKLVGAGVREATEIGVGTLFADLDKHLKDEPEIKRMIQNGRAGASAKPRVETARTWIDPNGYRLSDRLWQAGQATRDQIDALLEYHISQGTSAVAIGKQLEQYLTLDGRTKEVLRRKPDGSWEVARVPLTTRTPYGQKGLYVPRRLARTEVTRALGQAQEEAANLNPWVQGLKWNLSASHPEQDICDTYATTNHHGLGEGVYPKGSLPTYPPHPQCLCFLTPVSVKDTERIVRDLGRWVRGEDVPGLEGLDAGVDKNTLVERLTGIKSAQSPSPGPLPQKPPHLVRTMVGKHKTLNDAQDWGHEHYPHMQFDFVGAHIDAINPTLAQFDRLAQEWPEVANRLKYFGTYQGQVKQGVTVHPFGNAFAHASRDGQNIAFNPAWYGDPAKLAAELARSKQIGWLTTGSLEGTMTHEFGHQIDNWLRSTDLSLTEHITAGDGGTIKRIWTDFVDWHSATKKLSRYATTNKAENVAEGFASLTHNPKKEWTQYVKLLDTLLGEIRGARHYTKAEYSYLSPGQSPERDALVAYLRDLYAKLKVTRPYM